MLEIGGGLGVLSERLAARAGHVHVVEIDRALEQPAARDAGAVSPTSRCTSPTRSSSTSARSHPAPTKVVANLPYGIAATVILRTIDELPAVGSWVVMVQREVGERLAAAPGTPRLRRAVGAGPAGLRGQGAAAGRPHRVPPGPQRRLGAGRPAPASGRPPTPGLRARPRRLRPPAQGAGRLAGAGRRPPRRDPRAGPGGAVALGHPPTSAPSGWRRRSSASWPQRLCAVKLTARAPAKINLVPVPRADPRRRPPRAGDAVRVGLARRRARADVDAGRRGASDEVAAARASTGRTWSRRRSRRCATRAGTARRCGSRSASGSRSRPAWAAARPTPRPRCGCAARARAPRRRPRSAGSPPRSAPTCPASSSPGLALGTGAGEIVEPVRARAARVCDRAAAVRALHAEVYREADRLGLPRPDAELAARRRR